MKPVAVVMQMVVAMAVELFWGAGGDRGDIAEGRWWIVVMVVKRPAGGDGDDDKGSRDREGGKGGQLATICGGDGGGSFKGCLFVGCLTSQQQASVFQGRICTDNFTSCHTEIEVADQTFYLTQSQYTDTGLTSPSADPITPGAWQCSHWSANFEVTGMTRPRKNPGASGIRTRDLPLSRRTP